MRRLWRRLLRLDSGPWAFRLEELNGAAPRPIRFLAVPESPGPWTLVDPGVGGGAGGMCAVFPLGGAGDMGLP